MDFARADIFSLSISYDVFKCQCTVLNQKNWDPMDLARANIFLPISTSVTFIEYKIIDKWTDNKTNKKV